MTSPELLVVTAEKLGLEKLRKAFHRQKGQLHVAWYDAHQRNTPPPQCRLIVNFVLLYLGWVHLVQNHAFQGYTVLFQKGVVRG